MDAINLARGYLVRIEDARDVMLETGESFRLDRDGTALMSACGPEQFTLISLCRS